VYQHDEENRLTNVTRISDNAPVGHYDYDALGRRVQKIANPAGTSTTIQYFYDDARIIEEQNSSGMTQATYVYGNYVDEILTMDRGGQTYYYHQNALWSVEAVTNSTGSPVERYDYCGGNSLQCGDPYGSVSITDGSFNPIPANPWGTPHSAIGNPWMFTGRQLDEETGIYYYRARYYDPLKGRFLQRDPLGYQAGTNLYEYVRSRPTFATDPTGTIPVRPMERGLCERLFCRESVERVRAQLLDLAAGPPFNVRAALGKELVKLRAEIELQAFLIEVRTLVEGPEFFDVRFDFCVKYLDRITRRLDSLRRQVDRFRRGPELAPPAPPPPAPAPAPPPPGFRGPTKLA
jgi:RHS repeat-associated protein